MFSCKNAFVLNLLDRNSQKVGYDMWNIQNTGWSKIYVERVEICKISVATLACAWYENRIYLYPKSTNLNDTCFCAEIKQMKHK